jgi:hypothetical protein
MDRAPDHHPPEAVTRFSPVPVDQTTGVLTN